MTRESKNKIKIWKEGVKEEEEAKLLSFNFLIEVNNLYLVVF